MVSWAVHAHVLVNYREVFIDLGIIHEPDFGVEAHLVGDNIHTEGHDLGAIGLCRPYTDLVVGVITSEELEVQSGLSIH